MNGENSYEFMSTNYWEQGFKMLLCCYSYSRSHASSTIAVSLHLAFRQEFHDSVNHKLESRRGLLNIKHPSRMKSIENFYQNF